MISPFAHVGKHVLPCLLAIALGALSGCERGADPAMEQKVIRAALDQEQAEALRQSEMYTAQLETAEQQMQRTAQQLERSEQQQQRMEAILLRNERYLERVEKLAARWEKQAERYDRLLERWESEERPTER